MRLSSTLVWITVLLVAVGSQIAGAFTGDGRAASRAGAANQAPVADAGPDIDAYLGELPVLDGSGSSDPDGDQIFYEWTIVSSPPGSSPGLIGDRSIRATLVPDRVGTYIVSLVVWDTLLFSAPDEVTVTLTENQPPVAIIEATALSGVVPLTISFDGSSSFDPEGGPLLFDWESDDGGESSTDEFTNTFTYAAGFTVTLLVQDDAGLTSLTSVMVVANLPGVSVPTLSPGGLVLLVALMSLVLLRWPPPSRRRQ